MAILLSGDKRRLGIKPNNDNHDQRVEKRERRGAHDIGHSSGQSQACSPPNVGQTTTGALGVGVGWAGAAGVS